MSPSNGDDRRIPTAARHEAPECGRLRECEGSIPIPAPLDLLIARDRIGFRIVLDGSGDIARSCHWATAAGGTTSHRDDRRRTGKQLQRELEFRGVRN